MPGVGGAGSRAGVRSSLGAEPRGEPSGFRVGTQCDVPGLGPSESAALGIWSRSVHPGNHGVNR